jgi:GNAT superfamily N-acetyltransferase
MTPVIDYLEIKYTFNSATPDMVENRYINEYDIEIVGNSLEDGNGDVKTFVVGKAKVLLFLLGLADHNGFPYYEIFDTYSTTLEIGSLLYDWETQEFKAEIEEFCSDAYNSNVLFIDRIEILPAFRNKGIGKKIIKDILCRFYECFGVMVIKAFPLQFEIKSSEKEDIAWYTKMEFDGLEKDKKNATENLVRFYKSLGFDQLYQNEYFFYNSAYSTDQLEEVEI